MVVALMISFMRDEYWVLIVLHFSAHLLAKAAKRLKQRGNSLC